MDGTSAAIRDILESAALDTLDHLPAALLRIAPLLGAEALVLYVVDYAQDVLVPLGGPGAEVRGELTVDGTLAGRAYTAGQEMPGEGRLWVPVNDDSHRLGVLEVVTPEVAPGVAADGVQPAPGPSRFSLIAKVVAQLLSTRRSYGDLLEHARRRLAMQVATEIVWSLLPPLTIGTRTMTASGILEPCYEVGGDAFDLAVNGRCMHVAIFDAVGHGIAASMLTTLTVNAYRNARRCGLNLLDTYRSVDKWIHAQFPDNFVTAVLAELDGNTGEYRWINAGHPPGMLFRDGQFIHELTSRNALPLGYGHLDRSPIEVASERLQPRDRILLYTDGVTEARDDDGDFFGRRRLVEFVSKAFADEVPPAETMRRLVRAILTRQHQHLQDDASALLVEWAGAAEAVASEQNG